jgi:hypothetical protein
VAFIWHQGAGIGVQDPSRTALTLVDGNYVENAAQAFDVHSDFMVVTNNQISNCYTGIKVFHGSRGVIISNNIIQRPGKYGIMLRPGSNSFDAAAAKDGQPAREENVQRGLIIANNIITDMGYDDEHWRLWNDDPTETSPSASRLAQAPKTITAPWRPDHPRQPHLRPRTGQDLSTAFPPCSRPLQMGDLVRRRVARRECPPHRQHFPRGRKGRFQPADPALRAVVCFGQLRRET